MGMIIGGSRGQMIESYLYVDHIIMFNRTSRRTQAETTQETILAAAINKG